MTVPADRLDAAAITALYVPGDRPDRIAKALGAGADVVVVDLEDAVAASAKDAARRHLSGLGPAPAGASVQVRVNGAGTPWHPLDLAAVAALPAEVGVRMPKVESAADVHRARAAVPDRPLHALIESALGVEHAFEIARAGVATVCLGEADLRSDLGLPHDGDEGLTWARSRIVNAAAAAQLPPPMMSVHADVRDLEALAESCRRGRRLGLLGRAAIHPRQLPVIRAAFAVSEAEAARASEILAAFDDARQRGSGVAVLADGTFLDTAMVVQARRILAVAARTVGTADRR